MINELGIFPWNQSSISSNVLILFAFRKSSMLMCFHGVNFHLQGFCSSIFSGLLHVVPYILPVCFPRISPNLYIFPWVFPWFSGFAMFFYAFLVFPWFSQGFPKLFPVFPWFCRRLMPRPRLPGAPHVASRQGLRRLRGRGLGARGPGAHLADERWLCRWDFRWRIYMWFINHRKLENIEFEFIEIRYF